MSGSYHPSFEAVDDGGGRRNLYACIAGCDALVNHLLFRDYLRANPAAVAAYGALKFALAAKVRKTPSWPRS
jgi:GrpB-like predicted nucleotidyltransferase (UPF0157 family)